MLGRALAVADARPACSTFANYVGTSVQRHCEHCCRMASLLDPGASWTDVAWLRALWPGPLLLKGVLHPDEARRAVAEGIDGIIVSNHGGRQLDGAPGTIDALPGDRGGRGRAHSRCCSMAASAAAVDIAQGPGARARPPA